MMIRFSRAQSAFTPLVMLGCFAFAAPANAGFEWVSPPSEPTVISSQPAPLQLPPSRAFQTTGASAPVVIGGALPLPKSDVSNMQGNMYLPQPLRAESAVVSVPKSMNINVRSSAQEAGAISAPLSITAPSTDFAPLTLDKEIGAPPSVDVQRDTQELSKPININKDVEAQTFSPALVPLVITGNGGSVNGSIHSAPIKEAPQLAPATGADIVHGFANGVPVTVALRQILPTGYAFSINPNVDMGTLVSFKGGHSWRDTLHDALVPTGLGFRENGQMVTVGYAADIPSETLPPTKLSSVSALPIVNHVGSGTMATLSPSTTSGKAAADVAADVNQVWQAERGSSLHKIIADWCSRAHVEMNWLAEYDYPIDATISYTGSFQDAVRNLLTGFEGAHPQPVAELHSNPALGQMVLIVQARGNTGTD